MKLTERDKKLLLSVLLIALIVMMFVYAYLHLMERLKVLKREISSLENEYLVLQSKIRQQVQLKKDLEVLKQRYNKLNEILPTNLTQEQVVLMIKDFIDTTGIEFHNISFSSSVSVISKESGSIQDKEKESIEDCTGIAFEVNISYLAQYEQIKRFLTKVEQYPAKVKVQHISFQSDGTGIITGNMALVFYGFLDSGQQMVEWSSNAEKGKTNIFMP